MRHHHAFLDRFLQLCLSVLPAAIISNETVVPDEGVVARNQHTGVVVYLVRRNRLDTDGETLFEFAESVSQQDIEVASIWVVGRA